jgi:mRNA-degrading endonuclease RelE of RelBE toxin-antitoxin system
VRLRAHDRAAVRDAIERHLRYQPAKTSKSRIKLLWGMSRPQFRLRVGEFRVSYDVIENTVQVLAIIPKSMAPRCFPYDRPNTRLSPSSTSRRFALDRRPILALSRLLWTGPTDSHLA